jgi:folate-binding protein YgfZ
MKKMTTDSSTRSLPLAAIHQSAGAQFMGLAGWAIPAHYGDPEAEYRAARESVGLMDVSYLTKVTARGKDHLEYLNRRLSQRVIEQQPGEGARANQLNGEGRMEADFAFYRLTEETSLLLAPPAISGTALQALADKYVFTEEATFTDETGELGALALFGSSAASVLGTVIKKNHSQPLTIAGHSCHVLTAEFLLDAAIVLVPAADAEAVFAELRARVEQAKGRMLGFLAFDSLRVEAGQPWYGIDLNERSIPLEADLMTAIHTNKGCYPGQETIAKILNLGHPARKLVGVLWDSEDPAAAGSALQSGDSAAGTLTSSTFSPRLNRAIGLAMVRWNFRTPGTEISTQEGLKGRVVTLPFE